MRRQALALALTGIVLMMAACADDATEVTQDPPAADVVLRVVGHDGAVLVDWTLVELEAAVPYAELDLDGNKQSGPLLLEVLEASGVGEWDSGSVVGMGEGRTFEVELEIDATDVDAGWILDVTKQGSLKLASADLPREQWVRDVGEIRIR